MGMVRRVARRTGRRVHVTLPGGTLLIHWRESDDHVMMTGPVETEFEGVIDRDKMTWRRLDPARGAAE